MCIRDRYHTAQHGYIRAVQNQLIHTLWIKPVSYTHLDVYKRQLKEMSKQVDVLTLSATPIPRTLNMALSGIRDMSAIEEPPHDRWPVQTYVMEYNLSLIHI